jgi:DNA-binding transcriptional LysR family regulator
MRREELADLNAFLVVAEEQSFTRVAAKLGTSQSALSYTVRRLEGRLGVRLLTRTTRRVAPTQAGEKLLGTLRPALGDIAAGIASPGDVRETPAGSIRITTSAHAATTVLWPVLEKLLPRYPEIRVERAVMKYATMRAR